MSNKIDFSKTLSTDLYMTMKDFIECLKELKPDTLVYHHDVYFGHASELLEIFELPYCKPQMDEVITINGSPVNQTVTGLGRVTFGNIFEV
jgi:hypothetical protein